MLLVAELYCLECDLAKKQPSTIVFFGLESQFLHDRRRRRF